MRIEIYELEIEDLEDSCLVFLVFIVLDREGCKVVFVLKKLLIIGFVF